MTILSIDAGTTGVTAVIVDKAGKIVSQGYREFEQHFVQPGWVEHDPEQIWLATLEAVNQAITAETKITAIGITNQRETIVFWRRADLSAPRNAIVWQDRRSTSITEELRAQPADAAGETIEQRVRRITGLGLDPYFSSTKLVWVQRNEPEIWAQVVSGEVAIGTVDSYLIARLTAGAVHVTDASNASRTQLLDIRSGEYSAEMLELFGVPKEALPKVTASSGEVGRVAASALPMLANVPIAGIAGDQQAALFGHAAFKPGDSKCTYGTGAFILQNTGGKVVASNSGLLSTIAWMLAGGEITYALEGSVFIAGAAVQWLRDGLEIIESAADLNPLAEAAGDNGGVVFVPALTGLGAPHWQPAARGAFFGLTRGTSRGNIAQATLEAIAFQVRQVFDLFGAEAGLTCTTLSVDGGASANNRLMQLQADCIATSVVRSNTAQVTALGAAFLAGLGTGFWHSLDEIKSLVQSESFFAPNPFDPSRYERWCRAVELTKAF